MKDVNVVRLEEKFSESQEAEERINLIEQQMEELNLFNESLKDIEKTNEKSILAPLGKGVYIPADITEKKLLVGIGSGIFIKKNIDETKKIISEQIKGLETLGIGMQQKMEILNKEMKLLMEKIEN